MFVTKTIETDNGKVTFTGELSPEELDLVLSVGLNYLLQQGALPLKHIENASQQAPGSDNLQ